MVLVRMTAEEFRSKADELERTQGIALPGSIGRITHDGVTAGYTHANDTLTIHIMEKPAFVSTAYCEQRIEDWLTR